MLPDRTPSRNSIMLPSSHGGSNSWFASRRRCTGLRFAPGEFLEKQTPKTGMYAAESDRRIRLHNERSEPLVDILSTARDVQYGVSKAPQGVFNTADVAPKSSAQVDASS